MLHDVDRGHPSAEEDSSSFAPIAELAEMFTVLVRTIHNGDALRFTAERVVELAGHCMPASQGAELIMLDAGQPRTIASVGTFPDAIKLARLHTGEGPSLDVLDANDLVTTGDVAADERWPDFAREVTNATAIRSIASYRLYLGPRHKAALTFYSDWPYAFDGADTAIGAIFAAYCSLALLSDVLADTPSLKRAHEVHREVGVAAGILLGTGELDAESAYRTLHDAGKRVHNRIDSKPKRPDPSEDRSPDADTATDVGLTSAQRMASRRPAIRWAMFNTRQWRSPPCHSSWAR